MKTKKTPQQVDLLCIGTQVVKKVDIVHLMNDVMVVMLTEDQKLTLHRDKLHPTFFKCNHNGHEYQCKPF